MANPFPSAPLAEFLSKAIHPQTPHPLLGLRLRPPSIGSLGPERQPVSAPDSVGAGPSRVGAALLDSPLPPVRPTDLGAGSLDGIVDPSIVARQKGASPAGAGSAGGLTVDDLNGLMQYGVGGVAQAGRNFAPVYTTAQWGAQRRS